MNIVIISLFNDAVKPYLSTSMMKKAIDNQIINIEYLDLRDFGVGPRKTVDDTPFGGGDGMVMKPEPICAAIEKAKTMTKNAIVCIPTPRGELINQTKMMKMADEAKDMIIFCPRYEGYDERIMPLIDFPFRIGDYVLTGGELPAMILVDSIVRLLPGVLGGESSADKESFTLDQEYVEHPQYTQPRNFKGMTVPEVLFSGNHAKIEQWKKENAKTTADF